MKNHNSRQTKHGTAKSDLTHRKTRRKVRVLVSVNDGWVAIRIPSWMVSIAALGTLVLFVAVTVSPEVAARFAFALIQIVQLMHPSSK